MKFCDTRSSLDPVYAGGAGLFYFIFTRSVESAILENKNICSVKGTLCDKVYYLVECTCNVLGQEQSHTLWR